MPRNEIFVGNGHYPNEVIPFSHEDLKRIFGADYRFVLGNVLLAHNLVPREGMGPWHFPGELHDNSDGQYLLQCRIPSITIPGEQDKVSAYVLDGLTSEHEHAVSEDYIPAIGSFSLNGQRINPGQIQRVDPGVRHYSWTEKDHPALIVVVTRNVATIPDNQLHIESRRPEFIRR